MAVTLRMMPTLHSDGCGGGSRVCYQPSRENWTVADHVEFVSEGIIQPLILFVGVLTNITTLVIFPKCYIQPSIKVCLMALALSDLCASVFGICQLLIEAIKLDAHIKYGCWSEWAVASHSLFFIGLLFMCVSGLIVILVAIIRVIMIVRPMKSLGYFTIRRTRWMCVIVFVITFLLFTPSPLYIVWQSCHESRKPGGGCCGVNSTFCTNVYNDYEYVMDHFPKTYLVIVVVLYFPVIFVTYIACFIGIRIALKKSEKFIQKVVRNSTGDLGKAPVALLDLERQRSRSTSKATRTLLFILIADILCMLLTVMQGLGEKWTPCLSIFQEGTNEYRIFDAAAEITLVLRPAYNFFLYVFQHDDFKRRIIIMFCCVSKLRDKILSAGAFFGNGYDHSGLSKERMMFHKAPKPRTLHGAPLRSLSCDQKLNCSPGKIYDPYHLPLEKKSSSCSDLFNPSNKNTAVVNVVNKQRSCDSDNDIGLGTVVWVDDQGIRTSIV